MGRASPRSRRVGLVGSALLAVYAVALGLSAHFHLGVVVTVLTPLTAGTMGLYLALEGWWAKQSETAQGVPLPKVSERLAEAADRLAIAVREGWEKEMRTRRLTDPAPLPLSWQAADEKLVAKWDDVVSAGKDRPNYQPAHCADDPTGLDDSGELAEVLDQVPSKRLVVLGEAGAGKTILLVRLGLNLLKQRDQRDPEGPVPVLVPLCSWDPDYQNLRVWLTGWLIKNYPALEEPAPSAGGKMNLAQALLNQHLLLPILDGLDGLDGLDELDKSVHVQALHEINRTLPPGYDLIVSCRTDDYRNAIEVAKAKPLRGAAGVKIDELCPTDVVEYLGDSWEFLKSLDESHPVAKAMCLPLMVWPGPHDLQHPPREKRQITAKP